MNDFNLNKTKLKIIAIITVIVLLLAGALTVVREFKYGTNSQLLVIQEGAQGVDPFAVSRSVEYLSKLLSQVVYSNSFFNLVMGSNYTIDKSYFGTDSNEQMKLWKKTVSAKNNQDSGIIDISVYHPDPYQAKQIALAVNDVLITKNSNYQGIGDSVKVNIIDQPIVSKFPVQPNLPVNLALAILCGILFGLAYVYLFPENNTIKKKERVKNIVPQSNIEYILHQNVETPEKPDNYSARGSIDNLLG